jgi:spoIIIJ-associated protein
MENYSSMDRSSERGKEWLEQLLALMGVGATVKIETVGQPDGSEAEWSIIDSTNLSSESIEVILGNKGAHIDAIQYLANTILNLGVRDDLQRSYMIDLHGYRQQRQSELYDLAWSAAQQVRDTGEEVEIKHLSSAERKQIHTFLDNSSDLTTESRGQEPDRRLVVKLKQSIGD